MSYKNKPVSRRKTRFVGYGHAFSSINSKAYQNTCELSINLVSK